MMETVTVSANAGGDASGDARATADADADAAAGADTERRADDAEPEPETRAKTTATGTRETQTSIRDPDDPDDPGDIDARSEVEPWRWSSGVPPDVPDDTARANAAWRRQFELLALDGFRAVGRAKGQLVEGCASALFTAVGCLEGLVGQQYNFGTNEWVCPASPLWADTIRTIIVSRAMRGQEPLAYKEHGGFAGGSRKKLVWAAWQYLREE